MVRIAILGFLLESNRFAPMTRRADFDARCWLEGEAILADAACGAPRQCAEIPAFLSEIRCQLKGDHVEFVPILVAGAEPGGPLDEAVLQSVLDRTRAGLTEQGPVDAAQGFGLDFSKPGKDGSGKATLFRSDLPEKATPGVLYEIDRSELHLLDKAESAGYGYDRIDDFSVTNRNGETAQATTYIACAPVPELVPFDWYLALVLAGSLYHSLHKDHHKRLRAVRHVVDTDYGREARVEALRALLQHSHDDHLTLLRELRDTL